MPALKTLPVIDPVDMLPSPVNPGAFSPRNETEKRLHGLIAEGLDSGSYIRSTLPEFMAELRAGITSEKI